MGDVELLKGGSTKTGQGPFTVVLGALRKVEWTDIHSDAVTWRFTVAKTNIPHSVPLTRHAVAILRELYPLTGQGRRVFPSACGDAR